MVSVESVFAALASEDEREDGGFEILAMDGVDSGNPPPEVIDSRNRRDVNLFLGPGAVRERWTEDFTVVYEL